MRGRPKRLSSWRRRSELKTYLFALPALSLFFFFVILPAITTAYWSLFEWDGLSEAEWTGLTNYVELVRDPVVREAFKHVGVLVIFYTALPIVIGLLLASVLMRLHRVQYAVLRPVLFLPQVVTPVVVALSWRLAYDPTQGLVNHVLTALGLGSFTNAWLGDFDLALPAIGVSVTWVVMGFCMVLFVAGMQKIPAELYEAAKLDGANARQEFRAVTWPALRYELAVACIFTLTASVRNFDLVYNMTRGGPGTATVVPVLLVYRRAFVEGFVGSAAALSMVIAVIVLVGSLLIFWLAESADR